MTIKPCAKAPKMTSRDTMMASWTLVHPRLSVGGLGCRDMVEGRREGSQGAAPSAAPLQPSSSLPNSETGPGRSHCVSRSVT